MRIFSCRFAASVHKMLDFYSQFNPSPLSIKQFIDFGKQNDRYIGIQTQMFYAEEKNPFSANEKFLDVVQ